MSGAEAYVDRVKHYYQAQDAVLEDRVPTVWEAAGVTPEAGNTATLSLLNAALLRDEQGLRDSGIKHAESSVALDDVVVQPTSDGGVKLTATVTRSWAEVPTGGTTVKAAPAGEVEPSVPSISVFVFDRSGELTITEVPTDANSDFTDWLDPATGSSPAVPPGDWPRPTTVPRSPAPAARTPSSHEPPLFRPVRRSGASGRWPDLR